MFVIRTLVPVVTLLLLLPGCAGSPQRGLRNLSQGNPSATHAWKGADERIVVPFDWHDGHLIIALRVNGSADLRFAFDTGAAATVLFETPRTRGLRLRPEQSIRLGEEEGRPGVRVNLVNDTRVALEGLHLDDLTIVHVRQDQNPLFADADSAYFDGAIGYDLLHRFVTEIDFVARTITFHRTPPAAPPAPPWRTVAIDVSGRVPVLPVTLHQADAAEESVGMLIDTGAPGYLYLNPDLTRGIRLPARHFRVRSRGFYGALERRTARIDHVDLAQFAFPAQLASFDATDFKTLPGAIGLIGSSTLRNFDWVLDYGARTVSLRPNAQFTTASPADRSGIDLLPHRLGAYAQSVAAGSPAADIGVTDGAVVTRIDGQTLTPATFDPLKALLASARERLAICWLVATIETCAQLRLQDRL